MSALNWAKRTHCLFMCNTCLFMLYFIYGLSSRCSNIRLLEHFSVLFFLLCVFAIQASLFTEFFKRINFSCYLENCSAFFTTNFANLSLGYIQLKILSHNRWTFVKYNNVEWWSVGDKIFIIDFFVYQSKEQLCESLKLVEKLRHYFVQSLQIRSPK